MKENILLEKKFNFAVRVVHASTVLVNKHREFVMSKQFLRSGMSTGANCEEAVGGHSRNDFAAKLAIAYKEARETKYWIRLLHATGYLESDHARSLSKDVEELLRILGSILITTKSKTASSKHFGC